MANCLVSTGSNLSDRGETIRRAVQEILDTPGFEGVIASTLLETDPVGGPAGQGLFLNGAVRFSTLHPPATVLEILKRIEFDLGRERQIRWQARKIDLDLLLYDQEIVADRELILPHPRMAFRRFVLEPAAEIAAEMRDPVTGRSLGELLNHLNTGPNYVAISSVLNIGGHSLAQIVTDASPQLISGFIEDPLRKKMPRKTVPSRTNDGEIESLRRRIERLSAEDWGSEKGFAVSDFWLDESLVTAFVLEGAASREAVRSLLNDVRSHVVTPKLLVLLDVDTERINQTIQSIATASRLRDEWLSLGRSVAGVPVLRLELCNWERAVDELTAAICAMKL